jgi:hypothetical protein
MARRRPRTTGAHFEQRRSAQPATARPTDVRAGLSSRDARLLAERISDSQHRFRVSAIRLLASGSCGVILVDSQTGQEHLVEESDEWHRLHAQ